VGRGWGGGEGGGGGFSWLQSPGEGDAHVYYNGR
jgi:hypothetical protein